MIRELLVTATIAGAALATASGAAADPNDNMYFDQPGHYATDVPGMSYEASAGAPCFSWETNVFGRGPGGATMQCRWIPNQWPPVDTGFWGYSYPLQGVQEIGSPCPGPKFAAQAPDGRPMLCVGAQGWQPGVLTGAGFFPG